jgi:hypothetical protein
MRGFELMAIEEFYYLPTVSPLLLDCKEIGHIG